MSTLWALITLIQPSSTLEAPVYVQVSPSVLKRSGTLTYKPGDEDHHILFCIAQPPRVTLKCVVKTPLDLLVIIEAQPTEQDT